MNINYFRLPLLILFLSCFFSSQIFCQEHHHHVKRIVIPLANEEVRDALLSMGADLECGSAMTSQGLQIEVDNHILDQLNSLDIAYIILIEDMKKYYSERAMNDLPNARKQLEQKKNQKSFKTFNSLSTLLNNFYSNDDCLEQEWSVPDNFRLNPNTTSHTFGGCLTFDQVLEDLDKMRALYPHLISEKIDASPTQQKTIDGNTIFYVRISDNPDVDEDGEPETLYQSLIHSREAGSLMQLLYYMWYILENYDSDPAIKNLINNQALYFIPVFNPDGFIYNETTAPEGGGFQRKNRNVVSNDCDIYTDGVDLNRNSAYYWGNGGASDDVCSDVYLGEGPFSEIETQIMRDFFLEHDFKLALNHHSFKNAMLHAYAGTVIENPRVKEYAKYNHDFTYYNRYAYGPSTSISALNSGNMNDWMLGGPEGISLNGTPTGVGSGKGSLAWTPENGTFSEGGFWPLPSNYLPIAQRAIRMNFLAAFFSGKFGRVYDLNFQGLDSAVGELEFGIENLGQTESQFRVELEPVTDNIEFPNQSESIIDSDLLSVEKATFEYMLSPTIEPGDTLSFKLRLYNDYDTDNLLSEQTIHKIYSPIKIEHNLFDNSDPNIWTPLNGEWSLVDGPSGQGIAWSTTENEAYPNNITSTLTLSKPLDFSVFETIVIEYYAKWELERSFDYVQFEASTDGVSWSPLCGQLMKPGAPDQNNTYSGKSIIDNNFQPDYEPLYDGDTEGQWLVERIIIDQNSKPFLIGEPNVQVRFSFNTDSNNHQDSYNNMEFTGFALGEFVCYGFGEFMVSTKETNEEAISIYPNPVTDLLHISGAFDADQIYIYDINGQKINPRKSSHQTIDVSLLREGMYFLQLVKNKKVMIHRFYKD